MTRWALTEESEAVPAATVTLVQGASFAICDTGGDIASRAVEGLFVADTRICSRLVVRLGGQPVDALTVAQRAPFTASFVGRTADRSLLVFRDIWVGRGMRMELRLRNLRPERCSVAVAVSIATDLADLFAVKEGRAEPNDVTCFERHGRFEFVGPDGRGLLVRAAPSCGGERDGALGWNVDLAPCNEWKLCLELAAVRGGQEITPRYRCGEPVDDAIPSMRQRAWLRGLPTVESDVPGLAASIARAGEDLGALRLFDPDAPDDPVVAAGAPWYMTLFGRDSILTAWMALLVEPRLAIATAKVLARLQGRHHDPVSDEEPGRILHEVRFGRDASLALADGSISYATADATPLFVMLVHELYNFGVPWEEIQPMLPAVDAALGWMAGPGDADGDGYVEYSWSTETPSNKGWKDSFDGVSFADGRLPEPPVALAEVQGYAYAAWRAGASLAAANGDDETAAARRTRAESLRTRFERDFWMPHRDAYALGLDGGKRQIDAIASNMGHCLWSGIVTDPDRVAAVARWLVAPELSTGWGVRTLATGMARYNPLSYHNGSVWPHDTALCVAGLRRTGRIAEAMHIASGLLAAAEASGARLPELFAGLTADDMPIPVPYPASCSPQAWAAASPLLLLRAFLGLEPDVPRGLIEIAPILPPGSTRLRLRDIPLREGRVTFDVHDGELAVEGLPAGLTLVPGSA